MIETYLKTLFERSGPTEASASVIGGGTLRAIAQTLAFELIEQQQIGATEQEARRIISGAVPDRVDEILARLTRNGVLKSQVGARLQFPYPIVQEYLAACELVDRHGGTIGARIEDAIQRPWPPGSDERCCGGLIAIFSNRPKSATAGSVVDGLVQCLSPS